MSECRASGFRPRPNFRFRPIFAGGFVSLSAVKPMSGDGGLVQAGHDDLRTCKGRYVPSGAVIGRASFHWNGNESGVTETSVVNLNGKGPPLS